MRYPETAEGVFLERPNRFIAMVEINGRRETVHVKNTGRLGELLIPGANIVLAKSGGAARKTAYDLVSVYKPGLGWVNVDSQAPNAAVREWLESGPELFGEISLIKPEYRFGSSRVDFYLESGARRILIEVKGCTLEAEGLGRFPDAPTKRGTKHLLELACASSAGMECYIAFVIAMPSVRCVYPNVNTDPEFAKALCSAEDAGVGVLFLPCRVEPDSLVISDIIRKDAENHGKPVSGENKKKP